MNSISFDLEDRDDGFVDVFLTIDGETLKKRYLDHVTLSATAGLPIAVFDVLTCNCGVAGCAGYHDPLIVITEEDVVRWHCPGDCATHLGAASFTFDRQAYLAAMEALQSEIVTRFEAGRNFSMLMDFEFDADDEQIDLRLDPVEASATARSHYASRDVQAYAAELKGHYLDGVPWPDYSED